MRQIMTYVSWQKLQFPIDLSIYLYLCVCVSVSLSLSLPLSLCSVFLSPLALSLSLSLTRAQLKLSEAGQLPLFSASPTCLEMLNVAPWTVFVPETSLWHLVPYSELPKVLS